MLFWHEQRQLLKPHMLKLDVKIITKFVSLVWKNLSCKSKLVYDLVSERCRNDPVEGICYRNFHGIQEYKRLMGFPTLPDNAVIPVK